MARLKIQYGWACVASTGKGAPNWPIVRTAVADRTVTRTVNTTTPVLEIGDALVRRLQGPAPTSGGGRVRWEGWAWGGGGRQKPASRQLTVDVEVHLTESVHSHSDVMPNTAVALIATVALIAVSSTTPVASL